MISALFLAGCAGIPVPAEKQARQNAVEIAARFQPQGLPVLSTNSSLSDFLRYAMLNSPQVKAAYFEWLASVERITRARSLPDPVLTYQMDIQSVASMPGFMMEIPGPGKLGLRAEVSSKETDARYHAFETKVLQTAFEVRKAYCQLYFLTDKIRVNRATLDLISQMEQITRRQNDVGKATLQDVLRIQMEHDQLATGIANLEDSRKPLAAAFKAALGLKADDPAPPWPARFETTPLDVSLDKKAVHEGIEKAGFLPTGYRLEWTGQYEYMLRVKERLKLVIPITLLLIFVLLYLNFRSVPETFIILLSIPFAMTGSIWLLWLMGYHLSIAVWVGIIALAGLAAQTGTVMIIYLDEAFHAFQRSGKMRTQYDLFEAITYGAVQRVRPKLMTVSMVTLSLLPALWAHGAGAEAIQRIAAPMVGGLITTILTLEIVPAIYSLWRGRQVQWVKGPRPPRKTWSELSEIFVALEKEQHTKEIGALESRPGQK